MPEEEAAVDLFNSVEVTRWQKARWWRNLNRFMSVAGVFIIAAVVCIISSFLLFTLLITPDRMRCCRNSRPRCEVIMFVIILSGFLGDYLRA